MNPKFQHDCNSCVFLGNYNGNDLYYCSQRSFPTLIARHSDEGDDYTSGMWLKDHDEDITVAYAIAKFRKLIVE